MVTRRSAPSAALPAPISVALGKRVKQCRHEADKSRETLAFEAYVDRTYISAIERGMPTCNFKGGLCPVFQGASPLVVRRALNAVRAGASPAGSSSNSESRMKRRVCCRPSMPTTSAVWASAG